jgi:hypothetical protein
VNRKIHIINRQQNMAVFSFCVAYDFIIFFHIFLNCYANKKRMKTISKPFSNIHRTHNKIMKIYSAFMYKANPKYFIISQKFNWIMIKLYWLKLLLLNVNNFIENCKNKKWCNRGAVEWNFDKQHWKETSCLEKFHNWRYGWDSIFEILTYFVIL